MSRNAKIGISVVIGLVVLCVLVCAGGLIFVSVAGRDVLKDRLVDDPVRVRQIARQIIHYDLPEGYREAAGFDFYYGKMVMFEDTRAAQGEYGTMILVAEIDDYEVADSDQLREQFEQTMQESVNWEYIGDEVITLCEQETGIYFYEGDSEDGGERLRQATTDLFFGRAGMVFISIYGSAEDWPQDEIDAFLASIR